MNRIKNLNIKGLRGIKKEILFPLNKKSILLYGENGSGKSSVTDSLEWFYYDKIEHLSNEEIGRKGLEALRNIKIADTEDGIISIEYTNPKLNSSKSISQKGEKFITTHSNNSGEFLSFLDKSKEERIFLRYRDLISFILATKSEKLTALSEIIGFSEVIKTRNILRRSFSALKRDIKNSNFDSQISHQQDQLLTQLNQNVVSDTQYIDTINKLLKKIQISKKVKTFDDLDNILELIKKPEDTKIVEQQLFIEKIKSSSSQLTNKIKEIENQYNTYYTQYNNIASDIEKLNKIKLESLLSEGVKVLKEEIIEDESCPLCLQPKKKLELLKDLQERLEELQQCKNEKSKLDDIKSDLQTEISEADNIISNILTDPKIDVDAVASIKPSFLKIAKDIEFYKAELKHDVLTGSKLKATSELLIDKNILQKVDTYLIDESEKLSKSKKGDEKFDIHSKIVLSKNAYLEIKRLKESKELLEKQQYTLEKINTIFIKKMEDGFTVFLNHLSKDINDLYVFMNPGEHVDDISLVPIQKNNEFSGITIQFKFFNHEETPPNKYLSESHLNCLGLAFFLTSVKTFNKNNKFFVLDDVISSFDTNHRTRFANLLIEKFSDFQILVLTHEKDWFEYFSKLAKGNNWLINTFKCTENEEIIVELPLPTLKKQIENQISQNNVDGLGNKIRKYLEGILKEMSDKLGIYMRFKYNDKNENRMPMELLTSLKSHLNKHSDIIIDKILVDRLMSSTFIGNKDSHKSTYQVSMGDCKAFWADVIDLEEQYRN